MSTQPVLYDSHMHTPLCKHALGEPEDYAARAEERSLKGIIFTCHNPDPGGWSPRVRMDVDQLDEYVSMVARAREAWKDRLDVRLGIESDYYPGCEDWLRELHDREPFEFVLGSVHPHLRQYRERFFTSDIVAFQRTYFEHLAEAAETGLYDCISHPDLVKNSAPQDWAPQRILKSILDCLDRIAAAGVAMELNTSGLLKAVPEMNPGREILAEMCSRGIPVVLGSDSHQPERVAENFDWALLLLAEIGFERVSFFLDRKRHDVPIGQALDSLTPANSK